MPARWVWARQMHCLPTPQLRHPLRFICRHLGGDGFGEGSKDLIGPALAIGDLPGFHQNEAGRGSRGDALGGQGFLDASTSRGGLGRTGKGLVIVQAQVIAAILRGENGDLEKPRVGR